jgi:hypothetical protein
MPVVKQSITGAAGTPLKLQYFRDSSGVRFSGVIMGLVA